MLLPASYANGFAPRDGSPLYPELWTGCVGAWNPGLGVTGLTLRDQSGFNRHGTLTNGPTWAASKGRYSLQFTKASNTSVNLNVSVPKPAAAGSMAFYFLPIAAGASYCALLMAGENDGIYHYSGTSIDVYPYSLGGLNIFTAGEWHHFGMTWDNTTARLFIDGVQKASTALNPLFTVANFCSEANEAGNGNLDDVRIYNRALSAQEIRTLATRRGIAYEMAPRRRSSVQVTTNRRRRIIIGGNR